MRDIAVIGTGFWGRNHARVLGEMNRLACICDINEKAGRPIAEHNHVGFYTNVSDMILHESIRGAVIATPANTHYAIVEQLAKLNIGMLVEKPLTPDIDECRNIIQMEHDLHIPIMVGYLERFNPVVQAAKKIIDSGDYGRLLQSEFHRENLMPYHHLTDGIILDTAVHDIDLALWFNGPAIEVYSKKNSDCTMATIMLDHGKAISTIHCNWITSRKQRRFSLVFERAIISGDFIAQTLTIDTKEHSVVPRLVSKEPLANELSHFANIIDGIDKPITTVESATAVTAIALESAGLLKIRH